MRNLYAAETVELSLKLDQYGVPRHNLSNLEELTHQPNTTLCFLAPPYSSDDSESIPVGHNDKVNRNRKVSLLMACPYLHSCPDSQDLYCLLEFMIKDRSNNATIETVCARMI